MYREPYTENTILTWGPYKYTKISKIPANYLLSLDKKNSYDKRLLAYIKENKEDLLERYDSEMLLSALGQPCNKELFATEDEAQRAAESIMNLKQNGTKPLRPYECKKCNKGWHLTSISEKEWKQKTKSFR